MVVAADIAERQAVQTLALLSNAMQAAANAVIITDRTGTIIWANKAFTRLTGYSFEEAVGRNPRLLKSGKHDEAFYQSLWTTITAGRVWHGEMINRRKDDTLYTGEMTISPVRNERGEIAHFIAIQQDVTARKRAETALRDSEERHRVLLEHSWDAMMVLAPPTWKFTACNPATLRVFAAEDLAAFTSIGPGEVSPEFQPDGRASAEKAREMIETAVRQGSHSFQWAHKRLNGEVFPAEVMLTRMELGGQTLLQATVRDLTAQKQAEESLRAERDRAQQYLDIAGTAILVLDADQRVGLINRKGCEILDRPADQIIGRNWFDAFLPERDRERLREVFCKAMAGEGKLPEYAEFAVLRPDGQERLVAWHNTLARDRLRNTIEVLCSGQDITESRKVQRALQESEERFRTVIATARDAIVMMGPDGRITLWSPGAERLFGWTAEEAGGQVLHDLLSPPRLREAHAKAFPLFQATGRGSATGKTLELPALRKDGHEILVELSLSSLRLDGQWYAVGILRDATARKQAELALRQAHTQTKQILAAIPSLLIGLDEQESVIQWNDAAETVFSIPAKSTVGRPFRECGIPWDWTPVLDAVAATRATRKQQRVDDLAYTRPDGTNGFLGITVNPVASEEGGLSGFLLIGTDITERKALQTQLIQAQRLESIGSLAAGIAHEINTPTQFVGDNVRFLRDAFEELRKLLEAGARLLDACRQGTLTPERIAEVEAAVQAADLEYLSAEVPKAIEQSLEGVNRVAKIVRAMKDFSHPGSDEKAATDLNKAIETTITVARNEWKYVAEVQTDFDPSLPPVPCLPGEFNQVVLNLIVNAAHAIADVVGDGSRGKGTIHIQTRRNGNWAEIRVRDTGTGIPEAVRGRIFDPFFTTKEVGKGTGQGLAIAHSVIVKKHGGSITFETEVGKGTTFIIRLPIDPSSKQDSGSVPR